MELYLYNYNIINYLDLHLNFMSYLLDVAPPLKPLARSHELVQSRQDEVELQRVVVSEPFLHVHRVIALIAETLTWMKDNAQFKS